MKPLLLELKVKQVSQNRLYIVNKKSSLFLRTLTIDTNNDTENGQIKHYVPDYLEETNTTMDLIPDKSVIPVYDHMKTGTQFIKCLKIIDIKKVLGIIISLNNKLKYPPTREIGQRVVVRIRNSKLRILDSMLQDLPLNEIEYLHKDKYGLLTKQPSEEEKNRMKRDLLVEGETIMTVIDKSGAKYVKYIHPSSLLEDPIEEAFVEVLTLNEELEYTKRNFPDIEINQYYTAKITKRKKTFARRDGTGEFTKIEFCAELIEKID
jgi:ribosomal protein L14